MLRRIAFDTDKQGNALRASRVNERALECQRAGEMLPRDRQGLNPGKQSKGGGEEAGGGCRRAVGQRGQAGAG